MPFSLYASNKMLGHLLGSGAGFAPKSAFIALHTGNPSPTGAGEITGASSWRATAPNNSVTWLTGGNQSAWNVVALSYPTPNGNFGTASYWSMWDDVSAGNMYVYGQLNTASAIGSGNAVSFPSGALTVSTSGV
jgi:hypothetical protein